MSKDDVAIIKGFEKFVREFAEHKNMNFMLTIGTESGVYRAFASIPENLKHARGGEPCNRCRLLSILKANERLALNIMDQMDYEYGELSEHDIGEPVDEKNL